MVVISIRSGALAAGLLALAALPAMAASQEQAPGFYVSGELGPIISQSATLKGDGIDDSLGLKGGLGFIGAGGYRFSNGLRFEGEVGYRRREIDKSDGVTATGHSTALSWMGNVLYDLSIGGPVTPFAGVGFGGARFSYDEVNPVGGSSVNDSMVVPAYQGIIGASYNFSPTFALVADYRYFGTFNGRFDVANGSRVVGKFEAHTITIGFRWTFDARGEPPAEVKPAAAMTAPAPAPAPAPQAAPAPAPAPKPRSYVVFFAFDKAELTPGSRRVVEEAAVSIRENQATRITVTGHTDRAGPERYNFRLSLRRANVVKAELIRLGIPADDVQVIGKGMEDPAVPTPLGVREPKNRRAEIAF
jgi:OOP family OmpA-OmpF porin